jgi:diguanylate cyclase (GGDEF)-like protein/PAS domain S-box-containing protein
MSASHPDLAFTSSVLGQLVVPGFVLDAEGRVIVWNKACESLTGMPAERVLGTRNHWRAFYAIERPCLADLMIQNRIGEIGEHYPIHHQALGFTSGIHAENWCVMPLCGQRLYLEIDAGLIHDADGKTIAVVETLRDMTLRQSAETRLRTIFDRSPDPVWIIENGCFVECNDAAVSMLRYASKNELLLTHPSRLSPVRQPDGEESYHKAERLMAQTYEQGIQRFEWVHTRADGSEFTAEVTLSKIDLGGRPAIYCAWRDISERKLAEESLRVYARIFEYSGEAILITDSSNRIVSVNQTFTRLTGYTLDEVTGKNPSLLSAGHTRAETYQAMWQGLNQHGFWQGELWDRRKDGSEYPKWVSISAIRDDRQELTHYISSFTDITESKAAEDRINYLAHYDVLTHLCNRYSLESRLAQSLLEAKRESRLLAVMFIDLDRFKVINDALGHHIGDLLLVEVARRLSESIRESDIVARLGGDEFVVVLTSLHDEADAALVATKILDLLGTPYTIEGKLLHSTPSIGISVFPTNGDDADTLMKNADTAMYQAKQRGRNNFQFLSQEMTLMATERMELERDLHEALRTGQFELHYQPQISTIDDSTHGVEALIRWRHPQRGLISPLKFIPIAEETGVIEEIGLWVLEEACRQLAAWRDDGIHGLRMAVNLSAHQLRSPGLVDAVRKVMQKFALKDGDLELEVTESTAMADPERAIDQLNGLRDLGVELAIDDFGTGYSSLAYLKLLPIHTLKLDRTFVRDIETDANDASISVATIALAHSLGLKVVAEGIETEGQSRFLRDHGCDLLQGYLYGRPEPGAIWGARWKKGV